MEFLAPVRARGTGHAAGDEAHIGGQALGRGVARQHLEGRERHVERGHQLVEAGHGHVDGRQCLHHAGVALIGDRGDGAVFGNGEVAARNSHVRGDELAPELDARHLDELLDVLGLLLFAGLLLEVVGHLVAGKVNGRHDHVRGALVAQLDDPFAKVGLIDDDAFLLQGRVELDLLGGHGLGLDHALDVVLLGDAHDDAVGVLRVGGAMHMDTELFGVLLELFVEFFHVLAGVVLGGRDFLDELALVHVLEHGLAVGLVGHGEGVEGAAQEFVAQGLVNLFAVVGKGGRRFMHGLPPEG